MRTRRARVSPPCLTADILETWANAEPSPVQQTIPPAATSWGSLSRGERLLGHVIVFLIGSWNLIMIDLAREPGISWSWVVVAVWAAALLIHVSIFVATARRENANGSKRGLSLRNRAVPRRIP